MYLLAVAAVLVLTICLQLLISGGGLYVITQYYINFPCIILLLIISIPILIGTGLLKDFGKAFGYVMKKENKATLHDLKRAKEAVSLVMKTMIYGAVFISVFHMIITMHMLDDPASIGPRIAIALIAVLYAMMVDIILLALKGRLDIKIIEFMEAEEEND